MLSPSLSTLLKLFKTTSTQNLFRSDSITLPEREEYLPQLLVGSANLQLTFTYKFIKLVSNKGSHKKSFFSGHWTVQFVYFLICSR